MVNKKETYYINGGGGIRIYVEESGNRNGRPLLFIHGYNQCGFCWSKQIDSDLANDFRIVIMDLRGHGLSDKPENAYGDSNLWADDIHSVITTLNLEKPVLIGWSYGGLVISDYLRVYGDQEISGVNFVGAISRVGVNETATEIGSEFLSYVKGMFSNDFAENIDSTKKFLRLCTYEEIPIEDFYYFLGFNSIVPVYVRQGLFSRSIESDSILASLTKPLLLTHGIEDQIVLPIASEHHKEICPTAKLSLYEKVGHNPFWEAPERFNSELRQFALSLES